MANRKGVNAIMGHFWEDESGQGMTEYILIVALIAVVVVAVVNKFGTQIKELFTDSSDKIADETSGSFK